MNLPGIPNMGMRSSALPAGIAGIRDRTMNITNAVRLNYPDAASGSRISNNAGAGLPE